MCGFAVIIAQKQGAFDLLFQWFAMSEWWAGLDSNQRRRKPPDLQSGPFDRFGTDPRLKRLPKEQFVTCVSVLQKVKVFNLCIL